MQKLSCYIYRIHYATVLMLINRIHYAMMYLPYSLHKDCHSYYVVYYAYIVQDYYPYSGCTTQ